MIKLNSRVEVVGFQATKPAERATCGVGTVVGQEYREYEDRAVKVCCVSFDVTRKTKWIPVKYLRIYRPVLSTDPRYIEAKSNLKKIYESLKCDSLPSETFTGTTSGSVASFSSTPSV